MKLFCMHKLPESHVCSTKNKPKIFYYTVWLTKRETKSEDKRLKVLEFLRQDTDPDVWNVRLHVNATGNVGSRDNLWCQMLAVNVVNGKLKLSIKLLLWSKTFIGFM